MARTTKKELISIITNILKDNPEKEVFIPKYSNDLKNGRWGLQAYSLCYSNGEVMCRPWSGANCYWRARLDELKLAELQDIVGKCMMLTNPKHP